MIKHNIKSTLCRCGKPVSAKGMCNTCYCCKYRKEHPEAVDKALNNQSHKQTCDILKKHAIELKDDPERLTTKFMQALIGIECEPTQ